MFHLAQLLLQGNATISGKVAAVANHIHTNTGKLLFTLLLS